MSDEDFKRRSKERAAEVNAMFGGGYTRPPEMTQQLVSALIAVLYAHPEQRLGQIIENASAEHSHLSTIYDEELVERLVEYAQQGFQA